MTQLLLINSLLIGLVALTALAVILYWHRATSGAWRNYPAGRTQMHLLAIIFFITANAAVQTILPIPMAVKIPFYFGLYIIFAIALARVGLNIRSEVRRHQSITAHPSNTPTKEEAHE